MAECLALADLGASINLMPFFVWKRLSLPDLTPTCMTLELVNRSISRPVGVAEDVYVKVGSFYFSSDFVVIDFDVDPRVPLILERSFLKTRRALIDVFEGELTLRVSKEAITFNLDQTSRYSANYNDMMAKRIDVINMACEDDFLLEEVDAFLAIKDDPTSPEVYQPYLNPEGDILLLEAFLNDDPSLPLPNQGNYLPEVCKELKICEAKSDKSSIDEPLEIKRKPHSPAHTERLLIAACLLGYAMLQARFRERMLKRCEETNLCLNWEKIHFMVKEGIVLGHKISKQGIEVDKAKVDVITKLPHPTTVKDDSAFKYLFTKKDSKARLLHWVLLLQEFTFKVIDTKGAENLTADHLSRLENLHQNVLDPKEINESFPLETLNLVSTRAVDYLSKWVEAKALPANDARVVCKFLKNLFVRFRTPRAIISDRGTHFCNDQFANVMQKFGVTHRLATHITPKPVARCTPYKLVYGKACHLPIELKNKAYWALKHANFDLKTASYYKKVQINELNELCDQAYENSLIYKEKTKRLRDSKINDRVFNIGNRVLLFNSRLKIFSGKLKSRWSGPFTISRVYPYGTVELSQPNGPNLKVNGHRLKHYFGEDVPKLVVPDLQTFPKDH
nr:reverse transcriptase domain-containing protein [Tanacetum cinerariifolium]